MAIEPDKKLLWEDACAAACGRNDMPELLRCFKQDPELLLFQNEGSYLIHVEFEAGYTEICHALLGFARKQGKHIAIIQKNEWR